MNIFELIIRSINALRLMLNNPILGGGSSVRLSEASELFNILGSLILADGDEGAGEDLEFFTETVEEMATTGREPTPKEWVTLRGFNVDLLQTLKERLEDYDARDHSYEADDDGEGEGATGKEPEPEDSDSKDPKPENPEAKDNSSEEASGQGASTDKSPVETKQ